MDRLSLIYLWPTCCTWRSQWLAPCAPPQHTAGSYSTLKAHAHFDTHRYRGLGSHSRGCGWRAGQPHELPDCSLKASNRYGLACRQHHLPPICYLPAYDFVPLNHSLTQRHESHHLLFDSFAILATLVVQQEVVDSVFVELEVLGLPRPSQVHLLASRQYCWGPYQTIRLIDALDGRDQCYGGLWKSRQVFHHQLLLARLLGSGCLAFSWAAGILRVSFRLTRYS